MKDGARVAKEVLERGWGAFDPFYAEYTVGPRQGLPEFTRIGSLRGQNYGYVFMHKALQEEVGGVGKEFFVSVPLPDGRRLLDKLIKEGLIEAVKETSDHRFRLIKDPMKNLREFVDREYRKEAQLAASASEKPESRPKRSTIQRLRKGLNGIIGFRGFRL